MATENFGLRKLWAVFFVMLILAVLLEVNAAKKGSDEDKQKKKKKKDIRDYNDADLEKLFDEWEDAEDDHDPDDLPEHKRPSPTFDMSQLDLTNPENAMKLTKKGKTLMLFVSVSGEPTQDETDDITTRWQSMLFNAHFNFQRYPVSSDRVIFLLTDGGIAWDIKDFLIQQERCKEVTIESHVYYGKGSGKEVDEKGQLIDNTSEGGPITKEEHKKEKRDKSVEFLKKVVDDPEHAEQLQDSLDMFGKAPPDVMMTAMPPHPHMLKGDEEKISKDDRDEL